MLSRNLLSIESGSASRMASKPILGWGWCAMQKAWLMKPNQFPGFKSRHHAGSFSIHRYKWNTGFARFHLSAASQSFSKKHVQGIFQTDYGKADEAKTSSVRFCEYWMLVWETLMARQANGIRARAGTLAAFTPFPWWWQWAKSLAEILSDRVEHNTKGWCSDMCMDAVFDINTQYWHMYGCQWI